MSEENDITRLSSKSVSSKTDDIAPDMSEIRLLIRGKKGSMVHCTLPPQKTSQAVKHRSVEELWYVVKGLGEIWRKDKDREDVSELKPGVCVNIPTGVHFQFKNTGWEPLITIITTMPPWP